MQLLVGSTDFSQPAPLTKRLTTFYKAYNLPDPSRKGQRLPGAYISLLEGFTKESFDLAIFIFHVFIYLFIYLLILLGGRYGHICWCSREGREHYQTRAKTGKGRFIERNPA